MSLPPGDGAFVKKPSNVSEINLTFVGEVLQGDLVNPVAAGVDIYSGMVPQQGGLETVHGFVHSVNDTIWRWTGLAYDSKTFKGPPFNRWDPAGEPQLNVGEALFIKTAAAKNWTRTFHVN
jgi:hypothetical protein